MGILETIGAIAALVIAAIGGIFSIYDRFSKPDIKAENDINLLKQGCRLKHEGLDKEVVDIKEDIKLIKENHLRHIEADISDIKSKQTAILTILEAKYQIKVQ